MSFVAPAIIFRGDLFFRYKNLRISYLVHFDDKRERRKKTHETWKDIKAGVEWKKTVSHPLVMRQSGNLSRRNSVSQMTVTAFTSKFLPVHMQLNGYFVPMC